jgi:hypothetical protein
MFAWMRFLLIGISLLLCGGGCACVEKCCCWPRAAQQSECQQVEPQPVVPDLSLLPEHLPPDDPVGQHCALSESNAQCLAAKNSKIANLLTEDAEAVATQRKLCHDGSELASDLLILQATHKRNLDASIALQLLLRLAEAEGGAQNLQRRLHEMEGMQADVNQLLKSGAGPPVSKNELELQRLELLHRQAEVQGTIQSLNIQLTQAIGVELPPNSRHWPEVNLLVDPQLPDMDEAVHVAWGNRADLGALRLASQADAREVNSAARVILQPLGVGISTSDSSHGIVKLLHLCAARREADVRSDQLNSAYRDHRHTVEHEVQQAWSSMSMRLAQIAFSRDRQALVKTRLTSSQRQQELIGAPLSVHKTRLEVLAADQDLLRDVIEWKIAVVKLKESQGLLAIECGWDAAARCQ